MNETEIMAKSGPDPVAAYPHARRVGNFLFISGLGPHKRGEKDLPATFADEVHGVFHNLKVILEAAGLGLENVVDVTGFLTDLETDFATYNAIYAEYLGQIRPARTTIQVSELPRGIHVEIKVLAVCPAG
ncbi:Rid family hydrolase [Armatimonas sp.]|uniref:RidA family protein n=1 Tax=Armatimonas sp. TaxID=1872638 RepID=UPI00286C9698|nr:Rid family hydrolase [Armatimonas sp.]